MPGHGGGAVVHDNDRAFALVVDHVQQRRDARMEEGAVADGAHGGLGQAGQPHAVQYAHARAHGAHRMLGVEGRQGAEVVAADVSGDGELHLGKMVEGGTVRAAGAQQRAADRQIRDRLVGSGGGGVLQDARLAAAFRDVLRQQFAADGEDGLAPRVDAHCPDLFFHERIEFFHDDDVLHAFREFADKLFRQGIAHADLEDRGAGENLPDIFVEDAPGDEPVFAVAPVDGVARPFVAEGFQIQKPLLKHIMAFAGPRAHAVIFLHVAGEQPHLLPIGCRFAQFDHGLGVRGAHGRADDHRRVEPLADGHGFAHEILAFLTVARLQHGELAELGVMAVVLLVL